MSEACDVVLGNGFLCIAPHKEKKKRWINCISLKLKFFVL